jgi:4-hydroxybenzoate polyprenyltransferase
MMSEFLRIRQWVKNFFVFFPCIFAGKFFLGATLGRVLEAFAAFCFASSAVYILNDLCDIEFDRHHPQKSKRPLASGIVDHSWAWAAVTALAAAGLLVALVSGVGVFRMIILYIVLNIIYNIWSKQIILLDVIWVALGFQIRIWAGSLAAGVWPSVWLQMCTLLLALFLGFTKRRCELFMGPKMMNHRPVLAQYNDYLLDLIIAGCAMLAIAFYALYTLEAGPLGAHHHMIYTVVFVIYGIFRYLYLVYVKKTSGDAAESFFSDRPLALCVMLWAAAIFLIVYGHKLYA